MRGAKEDFQVGKCVIGQISWPIWAYFGHIWLAGLTTFGAMHARAHTLYWCRAGVMTSAERWAEVMKTELRCKRSCWITVEHVCLPLWPLTGYVHRLGIYHDSHECLSVFTWLSKRRLTAHSFFKLDFWLIVRQLLVHFAQLMCVHVCVLCMCVCAVYVCKYVSEWGCVWMPVTVRWVFCLPNNVDFARQREYAKSNLWRACHCQRHTLRMRIICSLHTHTHSSTLNHTHTHTHAH